MPAAMRRTVFSVVPVPLKYTAHTFLIRISVPSMRRQPPCGGRLFCFYS